MLRPFFRNTILHWHAAGLGRWLECDAVSRTLAKRAHRALDGAELAVTPASFNLPDARLFKPKRALVIGNGIPDPCPDFVSAVLPLRKKQVDRRRRALSGASAGEPCDVNILYLALGMEEKGLLDAVRAVHLLGKNPGSFRFRLTVAGKFLNDHERHKFEKLVEDLQVGAQVRHVGFLGGQAKREAMLEADLFCFPSYYFAESFGLVLIEAMAFGLPIVTTRWRSIPEFFPDGYPGLVDIQAPQQICDAVLRILSLDVAEQFRAEFAQFFTQDAFIRALRLALQELE